MLTITIETKNQDDSQKFCNHELNFFMKIYLKLLSFLTEVAVFKQDNTFYFRLIFSVFFRVLALVLRNHSYNTSFCIVHINVMCKHIYYCTILFIYFFFSNSNFNSFLLLRYIIIVKISNIIRMKPSLQRVISLLQRNEVIVSILILSFNNSFSDVLI